MAKDAKQWALKDVLNYFQEDSEIAQVLTGEEFSGVINYDEQFLAVLKTALEYQGFDPRVIMRQLVRNRKAYLDQKPPERRWDMSSVNDEFNIMDNSVAENIFSNQGSLHQDLTFLISLFLSRNNHISKIINKSINGFADILEMVKEKYDINDETRKSGTALGSKDITLPRITGVFPAVAVKMFHQCQVKEIVPYTSIPLCGEDAGSEAATSSGKKGGVTHAICCPFLPSLHPMNTKKGSNIHALMMYVAVRLDDVVHKKEKNFTPLAELFNYYRAGFNSAATPSASRAEVMIQVGLFKNGVLEFVPEAVKVNTACYEALKDMRVSDLDQALFLSIALSGKILE